MPHGDVTEEFENELRALVHRGRRVEAVRRYREQTGTGSHKAEGAVTALARQRGISHRESDSVEWDVLSLLGRGLTSQAVELYRERMGCGSREANEAVARVAAERGVWAPGRTGCLATILMGILSLMLVAMTLR